MPLSEEEARLLHQLEQSLAADDPDFASTLRGSKFVAHNRRIAFFAGLGFVIGLGLLFGGVMSGTTVLTVILGVIGFLVMLVATYLFVNAYRHGIAESESAPETSKPNASFVDRIEERWNRRQHGDDH